ncbi:MAG: sugar phosphate isomerase/epimerase [Syntrophaceae bacterium]|nr:sugar phosphate isomerase/epimerase [Syntrophaceae bacterium]
MITIGGRAHNLDETLAACELGLPFIEISLDDPVTVSGWMPKLLELKNDRGIIFLAHYPNEDNPFDVAILRDKFVPRIKALMDLSRQLGIQKATLHFWIDKRWASAELISGKLEILSRIVHYGNDSGIMVCIENLSERADSFAPAFEAIPDLKMTLDIGHAQLLARQNTSFRFIEEHFSRIAHIHVHDNRGGTGVKDDLHLPLGEGLVDYQKILKSLLDKGYDSTITMEVKIKDMPRTKQILDDYLRNAHII